MCKLFRLWELNQLMVVNNSGPIQPDTNDSMKIFFLQFFDVAAFQGNLAYLLMSIHAVNPSVLERLFSGNIYAYLYANMVYGYTFLLFSRVSFMMMPIAQRISCSILGSVMFNHASLQAFDYVARTWGYKSSEPSLGLATFLGFIYGRILVGEMFGYLKHIDHQIMKLLNRNRP